MILIEPYPKVDICVPVRNGARTIKRTLDSILAQDYPNYEIIVSNNCSSDDTEKIVQEYAGRDIHLYWNARLEPYGENNWNYILSLARGPYIALYHADDIYSPTMVRRQVEFLRDHPEASAVFTMMQGIDAQDRPIKMGRFRLPEELRERDCFEFDEYINVLLKRCTFVPVPSMMTRRSVLDAVGDYNWRRFASAADVDLHLRMAKEWGPIGVIDEPLLRYRFSNEQGSALISRKRTEPADYFRAVDAHINDQKEKKIVKAQSIAFYEMYRSADQAICSMNLMIKGKADEARSRLREAIKWKYIVVAIQRPRVLVRLLAGLGLLVSIYLRLGKLAGRLMLCAYEHRNARQREPAK